MGEANIGGDLVGKKRDTTLNPTVQDVDCYQVVLAGYEHRETLEDVDEEVNYHEDLETLSDRHVAFHHSHSKSDHAAGSADEVKSLDPGSDIQPLVNGLVEGDKNVVHGKGVEKQEANCNTQHYEVTVSHQFLKLSQNWSLANQTEAFLLLT